MTTPIIYEDERVLVVDKPVGVSTIPERDLTEPSVQKTLEAERGERLWVVHRLDKEVSGLLVFAKNPVAHRELSMAFERREIDKTYIAVVHGVVVDDAGLIDAPVHQFGSGRMGVDKRGKASQTRYHVLARGPAHTLIAARPLTGRRHQLRVHLYHLGHPIAGDTRYGDPARAAIARLMLHARNLNLPRPDGPALALEAPAGPSFVDVLATLGLPAEHLGAATGGRKD